MYIVPGNLMCKTAFTNTVDVYAETFSNVLIFQEDRNTQKGFDSISTLSIIKDREFTLRLKLVRASAEGNFTPYSLANVDTASLILTKKSGYAYTPEASTTWALTMEVPKSLGLAYREILSTDIPDAGVYWAELILVSGTRTYSFKHFTLEINTYP